MFIPLRFVRYGGRPTAREWTPRRIAAAAKAVQRERDSVPLFPEMARYTSVKERQADMDQFSIDMIQGFRDHSAKNWREARRLLRALPAITREGIIRYWNRAGLPADPVYLLDVINDERRRARGGWTRLRELRQFFLAGQGRLPRNLFCLTDPLLDKIGRPAVVRANTWGRVEWLRRHRERQLHRKSQIANRESKI